MIEENIENLCNTCYGTFEKCIKSNKPPEIVLEKNKVIKCNMYFKKRGPGTCVNCESGGRI